MHPDQNKITADWMSGNKIINSVVDLILILFALSILIASILGLFGTPINDWFARSGSILVLVGAILEYRCNKFSQIAIEESVRFSSGIGGSAIFALAWHRIAIKYIAHTLVVIGTLIWGYGEKWL